MGPANRLVSSLALALSLCAGPLSAATWTITASGGPGVNHTATVLYDGSVLFAGGYSSSPVSTARVYDSATGVWRNVAPLLQARGQAAAVMLRDGRVLVTGGLGANSAITSVELYDGVTGQWSPGPPMAGARRLHTATLLDDGRVLVAGGIGTSGWTATAEVYDPATNTWSATAPLATGRYDHSATRLRDGRVMVVAGTNSSIATGALASVEIYDPASGSWASGGTLVHRRQRHTATLLNDGRLFVAGGLYYATPSSQNATFPAPCEIFDPMTGGWVVAAPLITGRSSHSATVLPDGRVLIAGGMTSNWETATVEVYNPSGNSFSLTVPLNGVRADHTAALLPGGRVLVAGGSVAYSSPGPPEVYEAPTPSIGATGNLTAPRAQHTATLLPSGMVLAVGAGLADIYNPAGAGTWSAAASPGVPRSRHTATLLPTGRVLVAGGVDGATPLDSAQLYDPGTGTWSDTAAMSSARQEHATALLADGRVLVTGGLGWAGPLSDAVLYDPATATWSDALPMLQPRRLHTATVLLDGRVLIAGGDAGAGALGHATIYDPATDTWAPTLNNLYAARYGHVATLLPDGQVLLTGGMGATAPNQSADLYNPVTNRWTFGGWMTTARWKHTATLMPDGRVFVAGGLNGVGTTIATTDVYDPVRTPSNARWAAGPSLGTGRQEHSATLLASGAVLVAGGSNGAALNTARLFRTAGTLAYPPVLTSVSDPVDGRVFTLFGLRFLGGRRPPRAPPAWPWHRTTRWSRCGGSTTTRSAGRPSIRSPDGRSRPSCPRPSAACSRAMPS